MAQMGNDSDGDETWRIPSTLTGNRNLPPILDIAGPYRQPLGRPEEKVEFLGVRFERQFASTRAMDWDVDETIYDKVEHFMSLPTTAEREPITRDRR